MKVLLIHPSQWGRGITPPWIASHTAVLRQAGHQVQLFDCTFFRDWSQNETAFNTGNGQYPPSAYDSFIAWQPSAAEAFEALLASYDPDVIFFAAISSMIHGEGEYASIEHAHALLTRIGKKPRALVVAGGLQPMAYPSKMKAYFPLVDQFLVGESEWQLLDLIEGRELRAGMISLKDLPLYDYSVFDDPVFWRPYQGEVVRAADVEFSRGCPFTCNYCVETIIQKHYGFETTRHGTLKDARHYLRAKPAYKIYAELIHLFQDHGVTLFRVQDTNFLSIPRMILEELAGYLAERDWKLYIETRPDGITRDNVKLLKALHVDGVGMGIETGSEDYRERTLNRYSDQDRIREAFYLLREAGIKRTAYNVIGFPGETEAMLEQSIAFNRELEPDNITVAYFSPFYGTPLGTEFWSGLDPQLRAPLPTDRLNYYKSHFTRLVHESV